MTLPATVPWLEKKKKKKKGKGLSYGAQKEEEIHASTGKEGINKKKTKKDNRCGPRLHHVKEKM
jgi:hypothetical protein